MIQDIQPHQFDNQYRPCPPDAQSYALYYEGQSALLKKRKDGIEFPRFRDLERLNEEIYEEAVYLFTIDEERFYLVQNISRERLSEFTMENKESFRYAEPQYLAFAGITGYQLNNWYRNRKFCGRCGHKMRHDEKERMMRCDHCGNMEFPKICPAVIIGVTDGDKILMSKYAGRAYEKYALSGYEVRAFHYIIKENMEKNLLPIWRGKVKVLFSELKEADAAVLGASALAWEI